MRSPLAGKLLVASVLAAAALLGAATPAEANRVYVSGHWHGGHHGGGWGRGWGGGRVVIVSRPRIVYTYGFVGGGYYYVAAPPPVYYQAAPPAAAVVAVAPRPRPSFGLGISASGMTFAHDREAASLGALARFRTSSIELELNLAQVRFKDNEREDTRLGADLLLPIFHGDLQPYLLVGAGLNFIHLPGIEDNDSLHQGYVEAGGGLSLRLGDQLSIAGDIRWSARGPLNDEQDPVLRDATVQPFMDQHEKAVEGRVMGILYF